MDADTYQLGLSLIITPGATLDEMSTVNSLIVALGREVAASQAPTDFKQVFGEFYQEWKAFYDANASGVGGWLSRGFGSTYGKTLDYKARLADWRKRFLALGFKSQTETPSGMGIAKPFPWSTIAIGAGVTIGALLVLRAFLAKTR